VGDVELALRGNAEYYTVIGPFKPKHAAWQSKSEDLKMSQQTARLQAIAAAILFSTGGAGVKVSAFTGPQVAALRSGIAAVALLFWLRHRVRWTPQVLGLGVIYACMITLFVNATKLTTAAIAIYMQSMAPLYILVLAPFLLGERFRGRDVVYMAALAAGMAICFAGQTVASATAPDPATGNVLAVLSGLAWALTLMSLRFVQRDGAASGIAMSAVVIGNLLASAASLPFAWPFPVAAPLVEWGTIVYLGVVQIGVAYVCLTRAMQHLPALEASLLLLLEPVLNPIWTWAIRDEHPGAWVLAGGSIIIAATAAKAVYDARVPG
jgi:drug/metabolite transporter (DMT)-like permease